MKAKFYLFCIIGLSLSLPGAAQSLRKQAPSKDNAWFVDASSYVRQLEYDFRAAGNKSYNVTNPANHTHFIITSQGYTATAMQDGGQHEQWSVELRLQSIGRSASMTFTDAGTPVATGNTARYASDAAIVEYKNDEKGLRQNFILHNRPQGRGNISVTMQLNTSLGKSLVNGSKLVCYTPGNPSDVQFTYEDLNVWDATHRVLPSFMRLDKNNILSLVVNDQNAVYPITIDPLSKSPQWTTSAEAIVPGLLSNLTLQVQSLYGYNVVGLGDVNSDGFDDVAVSAPGMADVVSGSGSLLSVGAVFIYLGSDTGLAAKPNKVLQPTTSVGGLLFGLSVVAGNISADSVNDILVGAPLDRFQTTASTLLGPVSTTVTAGKVYLYRSEDLFATTYPSPFLDIHLDGTGFFSKGVLGLLASNVTVKALFGFSIGVTDDLNGDHRQDIVIGTPAYLNTSLTGVKNGAAFVYYSNHLSDPPVQLDVPSASVLGISLPVLNLGGLLFGFSAEGVGDYNNDGFPDVAVGAPAGVDLSTLGGLFSGQVLGGSVYIYYGKDGSGINTSIGASLQASPSGLLSNAANLFGYKIKGVRGATGALNGNILVSAPTGGILSNIVSGLRLKAGQVHVFVKKTMPFTSPVVSNQILSSPRSTSLLSLLTGQNLNVSMLYGAGIDNLTDMNCDGNGDIIIGEPLSTNIPIIGANITGGAVYTYLGKPDGMYQATPVWTLSTTVSSLLGVNATSLVGFSVAGAGHPSGAGTHVKAIVGGPSNTLDFGSGLLNLGNTLSTLNNFAFDNNGLGKSYLFDVDICGFTTLPTTLITFEGRPEDKTVQLNWATVSEPKVNLYEVEHSTDGAHFSTLAIVFAKGASHNDYSFPDKHPFFGINYYRLRIVDEDGKFTYSNTIIVRFNEKLPAQLLVAPNPVKDVIRVKFSGYVSGMYSMKLYDNSGQLLQVKKVNIGTAEQVETMNPGKTMPAGIYWLSMNDANDKKIGTVRLFISE